MVNVRNFDEVMEIGLPDFMNSNLPAYLEFTLLVLFCDKTLSEPILDECETFLCFGFVIPTQNTEINMRLITR